MLTQGLGDALKAAGQRGTSTGTRTSKGGPVRRAGVAPRCV